MFLSTQGILNEEYLHNNILYRVISKITLLINISMIFYIDTKLSYGMQYNFAICYQRIIRCGYELAIQSIKREHFSRF
jgi:hypothetical protein